MREAQSRASEALRHCLVEEEGATLRSPQRRKISLVLSVALQATVLSTALLVPLLVNGEKISAILLTPVPPYPKGPANPPVKNTGARKQHHPDRPFDPSKIFQPVKIPPTAATIIDEPPTTDDRGPWTGLPSDPNADSSRLLPPLGSEGPGFRPPLAQKAPQPETKRIRVTQIDPGQWIHRVQPVYPAPARQIRLEGKVELRAVISREGRIQELEVLSGHPMFVRASLEAVWQWRYRPTVLNGQAVEVETHITVLFVLNN